MSNTNFTAVNGTIPITNYNSFGVDLSNIFQPWDGTSPKAESTGFQTGGTDLNNIFQAWDSISTKAELTGFQTVESDLNNIFQNINFPYYNNADGTETEQTVYNKVVYNWTAPTSGNFVQFQITATGALNNADLINITVNKTDVDGNVTTLINGQFYTFTTYQTQNILIPGSPYLNAGDQIFIDYSTLETDRYFDCLVRSDGIPVISIYL